MRDPGPLVRYEEEHRRPSPPAKRRRRRGLVLLAVAAVAVAVLGVGGFGAWSWYRLEHPEWKRFAARDGAFAIDFPGEDVKRDLHDDPGRRSLRGLTSYTLETHLGQRGYILEYLDANCDDAEVFKRELLLNAAMEDLSKSTPELTLKERSRETTTMLGRPARALTADCSHKGVKEGWLTRRIVIIGGRLWVLTVFGEGVGPRAELVDPFFDSFAPNDKPAKE